ncbi:hypothetical protein RHMOL_Rhmol06G0138400 [Rhododendron molle]|uniref:Uncharacterized protein n=1 Tax=Rhododendron molle TaxID=49168 RepID=A0ACC0NBY1_RHOML|nr:hypothetical protein RHMOL_Rhmol06G0138400 [Rhododendron molle]
MGEKESFANFVKCWRAKAAQMQNKPDLKEQTQIITNNLPSSFAPYMVLSQAAPNFKTFYDSGLAIEEPLRDGTLEKKETGSKSKRVSQEAPEWEWDPTLDEYQLLARDDPLDAFSLPAMFAEEYQPEALAYDWLELAPLRPDFSHFNDSVIHNLYNNVGLTPWYLGPPEPE